PIFFIGTPPSICEKTIMSESCDVMGVLMKPGPIALAVILNGASSIASTRVSIQTPALLTEYSPTPGVGIRAAADAILMMRPPLPALIIAVAHARSVRNTPSRLTLKTLRQLANDLLLKNVMSGWPSSP